MMTLLFFAFSDPFLWKKSNEDFSSYIGRFDNLVVTPEEEIFILDYTEQRIFHLNARGEEKKVFSRKGEGPGEMHGAYRIQYHPGLQALFLYGWAKPNLYAFSLDGEPLSVNLPSKNAPIVLKENLLVYIDGPETKQESDRGAIIILKDLKTKKVLEIYKNNAARHQDPAKVSNDQGSARTTFPWYATSLLSASPDLRWLAMGSNTALDFRIYDLQQQQMTGHIRDEVKKPLLLAEEIAANGTRITLGSKVFKAKDFWHPEFKPPVSRIFFDASSRVWVALTQPWQADKQHYRVFSRDGKLVGKFELPTSEIILHASKAHLWISRYDKEEDIQYLIKRAYQLGQK